MNEVDFNLYQGLEQIRDIVAVYTIHLQNDDGLYGKYVNPRGEGDDQKGGNTTRLLKGMNTQGGTAKMFKTKYRGQGCPLHSLGMVVKYEKKKKSPQQLSKRMQKN